MQSTTAAATAGKSIINQTTTEVALKVTFRYLGCFSAAQLPASKKYYGNAYGTLYNGVVLSAANDAATFIGMVRSLRWQTCRLHCLRHCHIRPLYHPLTE